MSEVELAKMTSKGQIVIPVGIREEVKAVEGTVFAVFGTRDTIMLKRVEKPTREQLAREWKRIAEEGAKKARVLGIREKDVDKIIQRRRGVVNA